MMVFAWAWGFVWLVVVFLACWPWVQRLKPEPGSAGPGAAEPGSGEWRLMRWPLTAGLGLGALTLWLIAFGFWRLNAWVALAFPAGLLLTWIFLPRRTQSTHRENHIKVSVDFVRSVVKQYLAALGRGDAPAWVIAAGFVTLVVVVAQSAYYPFIGEDEISRYAYYARLLFVQGQVTGEVRGYPMFLSAAYAFVFLVTGQLAEQLARLIPAALSAMTVLATGALAWRWYGARAGWAAAFALIVTPLYLHWSPDGYVDIPSALYFVLCAYAADAWLSTRAAKWAAMAGGMAGLALWTKQAGFAALACLGIVFAWAMVRDWMKGDRRTWIPILRDGLLALAAAFVCGGWWYVRNAYYDGWSGAIPGPGPFYYNLANRNWAYLVPFIGDFVSFGPAASLLYSAGLAWGIIRLKRAAWPLVWAIPYTLLWWWLFSYDSRFMLTVLPFYAALFGGLVSDVRVQVRGPWRWAIVGAITVAACMALVTAQLGALRQWIVAPTASYAERLYRAKADMYRVVEFVRDEVPASARLVSLDGRLRYYLIDRHIDVFYPSRVAELQAYDYFVVGSWWTQVYPGFGLSEGDMLATLNDPTLLQQVYVGPGLGMSVYRVVKP